MLNEEVFEINVANIKTKEEALSYLTDKLISKGIVKESYKQAIIESMFFQQDYNSNRTGLLFRILM